MHRSYLKQLLARRSAVAAVLRPFMHREDLVAEENAVVDAYIYDFDPDISGENIVVEAELDEESLTRPAENN